MDEHFSKPEFTDFPISMHLDMLNDPVRMEAFSKAIYSTVKPGDNVVDIGSGTGILSFIASQAGANRVIGYELSNLAQTSNEIAAANFPQFDIQFYQKNIFESEPPAEKFDVVICELFGSFGIDESIIPVLNCVRKKYLKPGGTIIPGNLELMVSPVQCTKEYRNLVNWQPKIMGIDFSPVQNHAYNSVYHVSGNSIRLVSDKRSLTTLDFYRENALGDDLSVEFKFRSDSVLHGVVGWFRSEIVPGITIDTSPEATPTHWGQLFFPTGNPIKVKQGGILEFAFSEQVIDNNCIWRWSGDVTPSPEDQNSYHFSHEAIRDFR